MATVLITGANRGLGLEFARQFSVQGWHVHACCRSPDQAGELAELANAAADRFTVHALDIDDFSTVDALASRLGGVPVDLLINNAGILDNRPVSFSEGARSSLQALGAIDYEGWGQVFHVNVIGPMRVTEALLSNVLASTVKKIVMISSIMGSITASDPDAFPPGGGVYIYRTTKAALNMIARNLAADLKARGVIVLSVNPGWVKTEMGGEDGMFTPETSVANMIKAIEASDLASTGSFISHDGTRLPW
ncbi:SDR family oxidoreductase [Sphingomonas sp. LaA6.9]|uniref:SDR family oxidoreductase n=1 Tax=Sphingomonas sp. LaA6.9 TaxID=2919914 RepID=UPI001F4F60B4|nr:SDR family oxidoreductase [Sphingomonas sp. LaA6.9]MCJ8159018.1 SDR family oxidoreductase [Sphingomonas sp. LaA6.9]